MKVRKFKWIIALGVIALTASACGSNSATLTPPATRAATQTPWIIYVPVTTTPEPTILPLLPTAELKAAATRTPTRPVVVVKPTVIPTKPPVAPSAPVAKPTDPPACSIGTVTLKEPDDNALRRTRAVGVGGDTFRFIWDPPTSLQGEGDSQVGYKIEVSSKRGNFANGVTLYVSHNKYWRDRVVILDKPAVSTLAGGDSVKVTWFVTVIRTSGSFNDNDPTQGPPGIVTCGPPSPTRTINLEAFE
ncbi:MAG: hypothetical protein FJ009_03520 [Chloroflexi bacterium]|nr:hypothetical protein [Chloroflexota bacterium]